MKLRHIALMLATAALNLPAPAVAETHYQPHVSIGGRAGMTMSRMSFSPSVQQGWAKGFTAGVTVRYAEEKLFGLIAELNVEQRGWAESFDPLKDDPSLQYRRTLTYLELPVMTHINFGSRRFRGFVNLGPEFGVMIGDHVSANFDYADPAVTQTLVNVNRHTEQMRMDIKNKLDYGITMGLGGEYYFAPRHSVALECRFYYGLGNIFASSKADTFSASRGMSLQFTAGYYFRLK